jgi:hypothetical protein
MHAFMSKQKKTTYANLLQNHYPKTIEGQRFQLLTFIQNPLILIRGLSFDLSMFEFIKNFSKTL